MDFESSEIETPKRKLFWHTFGTRHLANSSSENTHSPSRQCISKESINRRRRASNEVENKLSIKSDEKSMRITQTLQL